ncbi:ly6/PLAUR domain-containing protein 5 isoform X2 [Pan troglodytes]|uniref:ly6/PLAUR domain-containing protein 5 isoform X2 n=1 Tax=Pan troglodytes TaxID=9598 RepID=UPI0007DB8E2A
MECPGGKKLDCQLQRGHYSAMRQTQLGPAAIAAPGLSRRVFPGSRGARPVCLSFAGWSSEFLGQAHTGPADSATPLSPGSQALQCYSFEHTYFGPFDLRAMKLPSISCPHECFEAILSLDTAPDPPTLSGAECYACIGVHQDECAIGRSRRVQCHQDQTACFQGNGRMTVGNFSVPVYIRTCHRPSCTTEGTTSPWTAIDLQGSCCEGYLCNRKSMTQPFTSASATTPPRALQVLALLLPVLLLVGLSA